MARTKSTAAIDAEIAKVKSDMSKLQDRYDKLAEKLKGLQDQKLKAEDCIYHGCLRQERQELR